MDEYTITYQLDGGTFEDAAPTSYETEDDIVLPVATRVGFHFVGWQPNQDYGTWQAFKIYPAGTPVKGQSGDVVFEAVWRAKSYPYSSDDMTYSTQTHRYTLTEGYVLDQTGISLNAVLNPGNMSQPQKVAQLFLEEISKDIYKFIYAQSNENDKQEYLLAKHPELRKIIREAMLQQVLYYQVNGRLRLYSGVNLKTGQILDPKQLQQAGISPSAKDELDKQLSDLKVAITYNGTFPILLNKDRIKVGY